MIDERKRDLETAEQRLQKARETEKEEKNASK